MRQSFRIFLVLIFLLLVSVLAACDSDSGESDKEKSPTPTPALTLRNWEGDISQAILDNFETETGIKVTYLPYESQEDAIAAMRAGEVYDVVVLENQLIPALVADGLLAELNYENIPNFKNISANFRDMTYDPGNKHAIPYSWGTTGLVVRTDLVEEPVTKWADLWDARYQGKLLAWTLSRYVIGAALKAEGYSLNSEDPDELEAALEKLIELKPFITLVEWESAVAAPYLTSGDVWIAMGQADDVAVGRETEPDITYVLPEEGGILWGDNFTIPANSPNKAAAETLVNYLISAEIAAQIVNETFYWLPNDAALPLVNPEIRDNPAIFPTTEMLQGAEVLLPLSPAGEQLYEDIWARFLAAE